jgi:hypothetical protein
MTAICSRCGESLVNPDLPCGFCICERRHAAVTQLVAAATSTSNPALVARVNAIDTLRNLGHSSEEVLLARARALDGHSVEEIVEGLVEDERVGVSV